jgi:hypothetical protein
MIASPYFNEACQVANKSPRLCRGTESGAFVLNVNVVPGRAGGFQSAIQSRPLSPRCRDDSRRARPAALVSRPDSRDFHPCARRYAERRLTLAAVWAIESDLDACRDFYLLSRQPRRIYISGRGAYRTAGTFFSDGESSDGSSQERRQAGRQEHQAATRQGQARREEGQVSPCELQAARRSAPS